ncbi:MAG: D-glycero-alpha-D-manno-heptose-1,7-bisphosphate 7-phosphatase [Saprospiraceae bacterium]
MKKKKIDQRWTLFLDRDGVLNRRIIGGYVTKTSQFEWLPGVLQALHYLTDRFGVSVVVTNQQGVGKGLMTKEDLTSIHSMMTQQASFANASIDAVYACPELADGNPKCRKPNTGMGKQAKKEFPQIDFEKSVMVGDSESDIEFGIGLGMKTIFIGPKKSKAADKTFPNLWEFAQWLGA